MMTLVDKVGRVKCWGLSVSVVGMGDVGRWKVRWAERSLFTRPEGGGGSCEEEWVKG